LGSEGTVLDLADGHVPLVGKFPQGVQGQCVQRLRAAPGGT